MPVAPVFSLYLENVIMVKLKPEQTRGRGPWYQAAEEHTLVAMVIKQFVALSGPLALAKGK